MKELNNKETKKVNRVFRGAYWSLTDAALSIGIKSQITFVKLLQANSIGILFINGGVDFYREDKVEDLSCVL